ncbi:TPA: hypothetical protein ACX3DU_004690, partial [Vibrio parahaemolyticus]
ALWVKTMIKLFRSRKSMLAKYSLQCMRQGNFGIPALFEMTPVLVALFIFVYKVGNFEFSKIPFWLIIVVSVVLVLSIPALTLMWTYTGNTIRDRYNLLKTIRRLNKEHRQVKRGSNNTHSKP